MDPETFLESRQSGKRAQPIGAPIPHARGFDMENEGADQGPRVPGPQGRLTFETLIVEGRTRSEKRGASPTGLASGLAALRAFMRAHGCGEGDPFSPLLGVSDEAFAPVLQAFEDGATVSAGTIGPYRSRLHAWNAMARDLVGRSEPQPGLFADVLSAAIDAYKKRVPGSTKAGIARQAGLTKEKLQQWAKPGLMQAGESPRNTAAASVLETILGLPPGSLTSKMVPVSRAGRSQAQVFADRKARLNKVQLSAIRFRPDCLPHRLGEFFDRFTAFKTTARVLYSLGGSSLRRSKTVWRVTPGSEDPIAARALLESRLLTLVGWMTLPNDLAGARAHVAANCTWKKKRLNPADADLLAPRFVGKGLRIEDLTVAHLVDPELLGEFAEWQKARNGHARADYVEDALALIAPRNGFLTQQVEFAWGYGKLGIAPVDMTLPGVKEGYAVAQAAWAEKCATWFEELGGLLPLLDAGTRRPARDKLQPILDQKDLMGVVIDIIESHVSAKPVGKLELGWSGSVQLAVWVRDQLLLRMLASNPLRNRNFREMRYVVGPDHERRGNLYQALGGGWRLRFQPHEFKNQAGAAKEPYDVPVPEDLWPLIGLYLSKARPILMRDATTTDKVFVNVSGNPFDGSGLSTVVAGLTGRHIQDDIDTFGIRTHAFRHIIATAWLRAHPKDYLTVAHILHDTLKTVLDNYAHHKPSDGLGPYNEWLATKMAPLQLSMAA